MCFRSRRAEIELGLSAERHLEPASLRSWPTVLLRMVVQTLTLASFSRPPDPGSGFPRYHRGDVPVVAAAAVPKQAATGIGNVDSKTTMTDPDLMMPQTEKTLQSLTGTRRD